MVSRPKRARSIEKSAQEAELLVSGGFRRAQSEAFEASDGEGEVYSTWRNNAEVFVGELAAKIVQGESVEGGIWDVQKNVAESIASGDQLGPFADYFFDLTLRKKKVEGEAADNDISHLPPGERNIVATNSRITALARNKEIAPIDFLHDAVDITKQRRRVGGNAFVGPENYAAILKFFSDKARDEETFKKPTTEDEKKEYRRQIQEARKLVGVCTGEFLKLADRDDANVVEMTNVLSAVKHLPRGMFGRNFSAGVLRHTLSVMDDFDRRGLLNVVSAIGNLDVEECPEVAAMVVDLSLRKGIQCDRSSDMLAILRTISLLPHTNASERAFGSFLSIRKPLEVSSDLGELRSINKFLHKIVSESTRSPKDTVRAKAIAENTARQAIAILRRIEAEGAPFERLREAHSVLGHIINDAKAI